jgi:carbonic anhydrase/acetyltransferase-like protein (isoleucine patch superfamily)
VGAVADAVRAARANGALVRPFGGIWPRLGPGSWVAPGAVVAGDVDLGEDASVWYGCVLRGDVQSIRVGARTNIQDQSVVHVTRDRFPCIIGDEVTVGHRAVVHGCVVEEGALIGIGAVVLDGARIGEGAWVGAGAVVTQGTEVAPGTLVLGTPAREVRTLSRDEMADQRQRTLHYVGVARAHAAEDRRN